MRKLQEYLTLIVVTLSIAGGCAAHQTITGTIGGNINGVVAMAFTAVNPTAPYVPGQVYTVNVAGMVSGGEPPYAFKSCSVSPAWFTLASNGTLSGTPPAGTTGTVALSATFLISDSDRATDSAGSGTCPAPGAAGAATLTLNIHSR